jgi:hypothetical protein
MYLRSNAEHGLIHVSKHKHQTHLSVFSFAIVVQKNHERVACRLITCTVTRQVPTYLARVAL